MCNIERTQRARRKGQVEVTDKHAGSRRIPTRNLLGQIRLTRIADVVPALRVLHPDMDQPVQIARMTPPLLEQLEQHNLRDAARMLGRDLGVAVQALDHLLRGRDPADAGAGRDDLGEGIHAHDAPVDVHAQQRRDQGTDELFVRGRWWHVGCVRACVRLHLQEEVGLVFQDVDVVFLRDGVDGFPSLVPLRRARRVVPAGYRVQEPGLLAASGLFVPVAEDVVHAGGEQALFVHLDADRFDAHGQGRLYGCGEGIFF